MRGLVGVFAGEVKTALAEAVLFEHVAKLGGKGHAEGVEAGRKSTKRQARCPVHLRWRIIW